MKVDGGLGMGFSPNIAEIAQEANLRRIEDTTESGQLKQATTRFFR